ncbi:outer membrane protein assembly factor BamB family protein [Nocardiopsis valliformis]|uniref:outer membrane protein assembly factor BamB family protein n=1 Tax=Nocardiopsis valliformis TaxID=239974 RepID=UPI000345A2AD|nr:PQQ-binding-like beta-propeller repeat protein [Nocardiopsis valliformis]
MTGERKLGQLSGILGWAGGGLLVGGLLWAVATGVVAGGGLLGKADGWWVLSVLIALLVLVRGVAWRRRETAPDTGRHVFWMCPAVGIGLLASLLAFPRDAFEATTPGPWAFAPAPYAVHLWLVTCAITVGCALMAASGRKPDPKPFRRAFPALLTGTAAVALAGVLVARFLVPWVPHQVADELGEPAPFPAEVSQTSWEWQAPMGTKVRGVLPGSHGPLALLYDGAVALDGETGAELWSYRHPHDRVGDVWAEDGQVNVRHRVGTDESSGEDRWETVVLDAGTGEVLDENSDAEVPPTGWLNEHGRTLVSDVLDLPDHCEVVDARSYGHWLLGVFGCLEGEDSGAQSSNPFEGESNETTAAVVAVDPLTETELWRAEWTAPPSAPEPRLAEAPGGAAGPSVVVRDGYEGRLTVLDPATGEELVAQPEELVGGADPAEAAYADTNGAVFAVNSGHLETTFHRVDPAGEITETAVVEEAYFFGQVGSPMIAVLDDALVIVRHTDTASAAKEVVVAPFGETTRWSDGVVHRTEREGDAALTAVPGAVVLLTENDGSELVTALVP